jgi:hypothetical protein
VVLGVRSRFIAPLYPPDLGAGGGVRPVSEMSE